MSDHAAVQVRSVSESESDEGFIFREGGAGNIRVEITESKYTNLGDDIRKKIDNTKIPEKRESWGSKVTAFRYLGIILITFVFTITQISFFSDTVMFMIVATLHAFIFVYLAGYLYLLEKMRTMQSREDYCWYKWPYLFIYYNHEYIDEAEKNEYIQNMEWCVEKFDDVSRFVEKLYSKILKKVGGEEKTVDIYASSSTSSGIFQITLRPGVDSKSIKEGHKKHMVIGITGHEPTNMRENIAIVKKKESHYYELMQTGIIDKFLA